MDNTKFKPIGITYRISDFVETFNRILGEEKVPKSELNDPSIYNLIRVFVETMKNVSANYEEVYGVQKPFQMITCKNIFCSRDSDEVRVYIHDNITIDNFITDGLYYSLMNNISNPEYVGNILPGYWDDRYSFDVSNDSDPHWDYMIKFVQACMKTAKKMIEDESTNSISFASEDLTYYISMSKVGRGYVCKINMPMYHVDINPQFFSKMMRKRAINNILEDDDE